MFSWWKGIYFPNFNLASVHSRQVTGKTKQEKVTELCKFGLPYWFSYLVHQYGGRTRALLNHETLKRSTETEKQNTETPNSQN